MTECPGCRAELPEIDGPTHRYIGASPACWDIYTRFLAGDPVTLVSQLSPLLVDAYAAQHPGRYSPQATQSVAVHLVTLTALVDRGHSMAEAVELRVAAVESGRVVGGYPKLEPVPARWELTMPLLAEAPADRRGGLVDRYVKDVLEQWTDLHGSLIETWYRDAALRRAR